MAAVRADQWRWFQMLDGQNRFWGRFRKRGDLSQEGSSLSDPGGTITVGKRAVAPDFDAVRRQNVHPKTAEEFLKREGH